MSELILYPAYPSRIIRNTDYTVCVTQGDKTADLPVYNELRQAFINDMRAPWGDDYRRFCEFAFSGEEVRVDITVNRYDFAEYTLLPACETFKTEVHGNVISVYLEKPKTFMLRLNDDINSLLTVFAEEPENPAEIPDKNNPSVVWIDGWYESPTNTLTLTAGQTLYIAAGAVCNARVLASGDNITICGRGMVRDPYDVRTFNVHGVNYNVNITDSHNVMVRDIKIVDCRFYHLFLGNCKNATVTGVKLLSNQISTDGFRVEASFDVLFENCYANIGDDVFTLRGKNLTYRNIIAGSSCGIFSFTGIKENVFFDNISVFRADEAIFKHFYTSLENTPYSGVKIQNLWAVDCVYIPVFFASRQQGHGDKEILFKNVSLITPAGSTDKRQKFADRSHASILIDNGADFRIHIDNLWIDGRLCRTADDFTMIDHSEDGVKLTLTADEASASYCVVKPNTYRPDTPYIQPSASAETVSVGGNLIENGSFADGIGHWCTVNFANVNLIPNAYSELSALHIRNKNKPSSGIALPIENILNRNGSGEYRLSFCARMGDEGQGNIFLARLVALYGDVTETESMKAINVTHFLTLTKEWTKYEMSFPVSTERVNTASIRIYNHGLENTMDFFIADVQLIK